MSKIRWHGVFPAVTTKLKPDSSLDLDAMGLGLERLIAAGVGGVVMLGMVGENAQLLPAEKLSLLRTAKAAVAGRVPIVAGLAETSTEAAVAFARQAENIGVDGLMVFPGLTYKSDVRETVQFYKTVARASGLEILLYNNPRGYGVDLTADLIAQLLEEPSIVAIKEESYETYRVTELMRRFGNRLAVVCGVDNLILESAALGVCCWVSGMANAVPKPAVDLLNMLIAGDFANARKLNAALDALFLLDTVVKLVQHIKLAEHITSGSAETVKAPRLPLAGLERERTVTIVMQTLADLQALAT